MATKACAAALGDGGTSDKALKAQRADPFKHVSLQPSVALKRRDACHAESVTRAAARHSIAGLVMAGGWRPASSQPTAAAARGTPTTRRTRGSTGIRPR
jgi:hypothetical protein